MACMKVGVAAPEAALIDRWNAEVPAALFRVPDPPTGVVETKPISASRCAHQLFSDSLNDS
jgi:hypothetical protein